MDPITAILGLTIGWALTEEEKKAPPKSADKELAEAVSKVIAEALTKKKD